MDEEKIYNIRHSLSHLLAAAVLELYPEAKPTLGPPVDNGFYYDFDFENGEKPSPKELGRIEQKMRELSKKWEKITEEEVSKKDALAYFANNPYKTELIEDIAKSKEPITFYHSGSKDAELTIENALFTDLCEGGHVDAPKADLKDVGYKLDRIAGAYWRGDEKNTMLTRIYGLAFESKDALKEYEASVEEAKKRDHRKLGKDLDLFTFSDLVGAGLPLWTPLGTALRHELDQFVWELRSKHKYGRVTIPHITKMDLYKTSGHYDKFAEELFRVMTREGKEYALKPMNCPHHTQIFARRPHSYKEMPQRYAETTMVYRDEQSGELGGLTRVLSITQDDSHVFCRRNQIKDEFYIIWDIVDKLYSAFNFELKVRLSFHDPENMDKYLGDAAIWEDAENSLREIAQERNADYFEAKGEAAMYGPKLDFVAKDSLGREHQVATIQLDFNLPERFDLTCINEEGQKERVVMVHAAIMGSIERFTAVLIEHLEGNFPLWLAPVQIQVIPIAKTHAEYAQKTVQALEDAGVRVTLDDTAASFGKKVHRAKTNKVPYFICVGDKEVETNTIKLENREGEVTETSFDEAITLITEKIANRE